MPEDNRLELALDAGAVAGTWVWDVVDDRLTADLRFARYFALDPARLQQGVPLFDVVRSIHPEDVARMREAVEKSLREGGPYRCEYRVRQVDGRYRWVEASGKVILGAQGEAVSFPGVLIDIEHRKQAEFKQLALLQLGDALRGIVDVSAIVEAASAICGQTLNAFRAGYGRMDSASAVVQIEDDWCRDPGLPSVTGDYRLADYGSFFEDLRRGEVVAVADVTLDARTVDRVAALKRLDIGALLNVPLMRDGRLAGVFLVHEDGPRTWTDEEIAFVRGVADRTWAAMATAEALGELRRANEALIQAAGRDVSELNAQRELLQQAEDQLRQSQKMEAIGQLTGGIAHDFNNLLTIISTSIQLLKRPNLAEERRQRFMGSISDAVGRATKLTGQLLAFARRQALQPVVFDASHNITAIADMVQTLIGSRIALSISADTPGCMVDADPGQFDTALVNMAANARDAMDGVGRLAIEVRRVTAIPALRHHAAVPGEFVAVSVRDSGTGIADGQIDRIFEPFFTTKAVGQGTGLGLSQVFGFAKQSGGDIQVESTVGQGTTFTLYLPLARRPRMVDDSTDDTAAPCAAPTGRLLVVEDHHAVAAAAEESLVELGYTVTKVHSAEDALTLLATDASQFCAVFSDVMLSHIDGVAFAREIRRLYPRLPVLLCSGYSSVLASSERHGFPLLPKPYSLDALARALNDAIMQPGGAQAAVRDAKPQSEFEAARRNAERARLTDLESLGVLDTPPEADYDEVTRLAATLFDAPIALVSLVDADRQWFKSRTGLDSTQTPREQSFCAHAIVEPGKVMVVNDASKDARFADNPLVTSDPHIRFYAGAPLVTSWGHAIGTICVIDTVAREADPRRLEALKVLARQVVERLEKDRLRPS